MYENGVSEMSDGSLKVIDDFLDSTNVRMETISPKRVFSGLGMIAIHAIDCKDQT